MTKKEKKDYYQALVNHGFFSRMNKFLYSSNYGICSWTIYTVGKFSHKENAILLEDAYNRHYKNKNPMLCHRCLGELHWLKPGQAEPYLEELQKNPSLTNLLILFYYFDSMSYDPRYKQLIENEMLACAILADSIVKKKRDKIEEIIDARTSDAIALALRFNAPIFTYKNILDKAGIYLKVNPHDD